MRTLTWDKSVRYRFAISITLFYLFTICSGGIWTASCRMLSIDADHSTMPSHRPWLQSRLLVTRRTITMGKEQQSMLKQKSLEWEISCFVFIFAFKGKKQTGLSLMAHCQMLCLPHGSAFFEQVIFVTIFCLVVTLTIDLLTKNLNSL